MATPPQVLLPPRLPHTSLAGICFLKSSFMICGYFLKFLYNPVMDTIGGQDAIYRSVSLIYFLTCAHFTLLQTNIFQTVYGMACFWTLLQSLLLLLYMVGWQWSEQLRREHFYQSVSLSSHHLSVFFLGYYFACVIRLKAKTAFLQYLKSKKCWICQIWWLLANALVSEVYKIMLDIIQSQNDSSVLVGLVCSSSFRNVKSVSQVHSLLFVVLTVTIFLKHLFSSFHLSTFMIFLEQKNPPLTYINILIGREEIANKITLLGVSFVSL